MEREKEFDSILTLMQVQNNYINQVARMITHICSDALIASNLQFREFTTHFLSFIQNQAGSEGFGRALNAVQSYHYTLVERLLEQEILGAAEQLELAINHLEMAAREPHIRVHPHIPLLNQGVCLLEETELKIIESLETFIEVFRPLTLQN